MKSKTYYLGSFILALIISCIPGFAFAYAYDGDDADTMWGTTINNNDNNDGESIVLASNSSYHGYTYGFPKYRTANGIPVFIFNPKVHAWAFYNSNGVLLKVGKGSGGSNYCRDLHHSCHTPTGAFHVYAKGGAGCKSKKFPLGKGGAPMPYCSYFHGGFAIHGSYEVRSYNASHGCIRIYPADAKWLQPKMPIGTTVIVMPY